MNPGMSRQVKHAQHVGPALEPAPAAPEWSVSALDGVAVEPGVAPSDGPRFWRDALRRRMLALADVLAASTAAVAATDAGADLAWALLAVPVWILLAKLFGLYDRDHRALRHITLDEVGAIATWAGAGVATTALFLSLTPADPLGPGAVVFSFAIAAMAGFTLRAAARWLWRRLTPPERTAVVGDGDLARSIRRKLRLFSDMHLRLVDPEPDATELDGVGAGLDRIVLASPSAETTRVAELAAACREHGVKLSVVSPLRGRSRPAGSLTRVADLPVLEYETWDVSRSTMLLKRIFDLTFGSLLMLVTLPLLPVIALAIRVETRGSVIFAQTRAGLDGEPFRLFKFRTMVADAEHRLGELVTIDELAEPMFKFANDPRVTRVGRLLRRYSLDELPQLVNVLRGEMSIVGPRPEQIDLVERYRPEHRFRLAVKPGLTGPMQVFGRGDLTFAERLEVELDYVERVSLARDLRILAETVPAIIRGTGAY